MIEEINDEKQDCKVNFLHPPGPTRNFHWPKRADTCWVPYTDIICPLNTPVTVTGRAHNILESDFQNIVTKFV